LPVVSIDT